MSNRPSRDPYPILFTDEDVERLQKAAARLSETIRAAASALESAFTANMLIVLGVPGEDLPPELLDTVTTVTAQDKEAGEKHHPCPYNPPRRPVKAVKAVCQFYPINKKRPQARSAIRRLGGRRRT